MPKTIAGVTIPDSKMATEATEFVRDTAKSHQSAGERFEVDGANAAPFCAGTRSPKSLSI